MSARNPGRMLILGRISSVYGVRGWVKVHSETEPNENILTYSPWYVGSGYTPRSIAEGRRHGKGLIARLEGCGDRERARELVGLEIAVRRDQLPPPSEEEFYWADLEGLAVETPSGTPLGRIERIFSTPGNDVIVVRGERERLIPFIWGDVVHQVDIDNGLVRVDWDPDF